MKTPEGVEAIITHLSRWRYGEGMGQTTHGFQPAAKAEVVSIILWFRVQIPVGPPSKHFSTSGMISVFRKAKSSRYIIPLSAKINVSREGKGTLKALKSFASDHAYQRPQGLSSFRVLPQFY